MTKKEKILISQAIEFIREDDGYEKGMRILYDLIGNKSYGKFLNMIKNCKNTSMLDLLKRGE